jgi:hypothetical protein
LRGVIAGASALALLDLLTALASRRARRSAPDLAPVTRATTGLVAPLVDVRSALAGQPRQPVPSRQPAAGPQQRPQEPQEPQPPAVPGA